MPCSLPVFRQFVADRPFYFDVFLPKLVPLAKDDLLMFLSKMPLWLSGIILVGMTMLVAMSGPALIRRRIHLDRLRVNNEVAGLKFATVGVLYAELLAFAVIVVWEKFAEAERTVAKEAGAVATLYRLSGGLDEEPGKAFRQDVTDYGRAVISEDWPAMEQGRASG